MTTIHGFELIRQQPIPELNTQARLLRHVQTGAELLSLENDVENKVFGMVFRTPPADSTGVPHIMEHAVLGGSRKYQVKEPFVELIKGSLYTFLNAMTSPDKTSYPVASQNLQDFYNLVDVYLDAVLYPLITPYHLQQEGWHYELEHPDDPLIYKGVVFNEMKGGYSSPDNLFNRYNQLSLFPDNVYKHDAGGDPQEIPNLTYEQFKQFHEQYYHPSNARVFFYGDDDPKERLRILNEYLKDFEAIEPDSAVSLQAPFSEPKRLTFPYDAGEEADSARKGMVRVNWLLPENHDPALTMALSILSHALVSTPASPLRKVLIDSGLGEDLSGWGLSTHLRQMTFAVGLKGIDPEEAGKVESLILDTLSRLAREGIEREMVEAAVNTIEFQLRENNTGRFPRGMSLMFRAMSTWIHDGDPLGPLAFEAPLAAVKERLASDDGFLQTLIRTHLIDNPHRVTVLFKPDHELGRQQEAAEKEKLAQIKAAMSAAEIESIIENTKRLKRLQETPDTPEALAAIPRLGLDDLEREAKPIPLAVSQQDGSQILYHDLFTNGIVYLDLGFNLHLLPQELLPYAQLFGRALVEMGSETEDFVRLSQRIGAKTGGISAVTFTSAIKNGDQGSAWLFLRGKATTTQTADLLAIMRDVLLTVRLDNPERFRQIVLNAKAQNESGLVPSGHQVVNTRLRAHFNEADWAAEQIGGISYLFFLRRLAEEIEENWTAVLDRLEQVRQLLVSRNGLICNVTLDEDNWSRFRPQLDEFLASLPDRPPQLVYWTPEYPSGNEGLTIPAKVNYVSKGACLYDLGYDLHGSVEVIGKFLRTTWLWEKVRVQGGAYGGFSSFDRRSGVFSYLSYRDPNLLSTLENYDATVAYLRRLDLSEGELVKSIIGAIGALDAYQLPDAKGYASMIRHLLGETDADRQRFRDQVLSTTAADFRAFADVLDEARKQGLVVVLGSQEAIEAANAAKGDWLRVSKVM